MKKLTIFITLFISFCGTQSFAYNIYNQTGYAVHVQDNGDHWPRGIDVTIPNDRQAACNPTSVGCLR